ncbi:chaperone NapD [Palleronia caenipelagi]|uniref:Chaperone NapD n=1 Tax=Palleronia caenipelagi TaxID=2489174 RepID=A0A547QAA2_9RHOB|nr:chaperone NapD [Palleronia caenipelagi]TRD23246.1 nitrate reductase [Palleronia caenipelagi]
MNICGCLVHAAPGTVTETRARLEAMPGAEVHAESEDGRLVVVVEDMDDRKASDTIMEMHQIPGVLSVTLNYHHFEDLSQRDTARGPQAGELS